MPRCAAKWPLKTHPADRLCHHQYDEDPGIGPGCFGLTENTAYLLSINGLFDHPSRVAPLSQEPSVHFPFASVCSESTVTPESLRRCIERFAHTTPCCVRLD